MLVFCFKQKTAYELRISDWSSDVCSSDLRELWAEYAGRTTGSCKGKGGPMHITHPESGVVVTTGIVGSGIPIANGLALAAQVRGEDRVAVTNFGDGASNIGAFHEALNLAAIWKLPVIRSEEHTSELQSLMRISYAVFCLKKKTENT